MDTLSLLTVLGVTVFFVTLCVGGMYANAHRDRWERSQKQPKIAVERGYRVRGK